MSTKAMTISAAVLVFLLALGLTLYPLISNQYNQQHQSQIHTAYLEQVEQMKDADILIARTMAVAYNEVLKPGVQDRDAYSRDALLVAAQDYDNQLDITGSGIMGYVDIPKISVTLPIYHGTDSNTLSAGVGHLLGSSLPIGGESTHTILTAHSGMASQKMFSDLDQLGEGMFSIWRCWMRSLPIRWMRFKPCCPMIPPIWASPRERITVPWSPAPPLA